MKLARSTLLGAAGVILALGIAGAQAGSPEGGASPGGAGAAAPQAGGGESAGAPSAAPEGGGGGSMATEGGAEPGKAVEESGGAEDSGKAATQEAMPSEDKSAKTSGADKADTKGTAAEQKTGTEAEGEAASETKSKAGMDDDAKSGATAKGDADLESKSGATTKGGADVDTEAGATVEGKASKSVRLESEQVGKVKTYFSEHKPSVTVIDKDEISVSVGIALPSTVVLYDLPPDIIVVEGACQIKYFVWGDDIVLVDSCSREVVEIIVGVA